MHRQKINNIMSKTNPVLDSKRNLIMNKFYQHKDKNLKFTFKGISINIFVEKLLAVEK